MNKSLSFSIDTCCNISVCWLRYLWLTTASI